jgi:integrase
VRKEKRLAEAAMTSHDINRMMKRYLRRAGLPHILSPHSFRVTTITDLLDQSLPGPGHMKVDTFGKPYLPTLLAMK